MIFVILILKYDFIQFKLGTIAIKIKKKIKKGIINLLKKGGPIEIFSSVITSRKIGYTVPIKITAKKYIRNQLFTKIDASLLIQFIFIFFKLLSLKNVKKINKAINIKIKRNININIPLSGSFAKVCTELSIPERTKNVPLILNVNEAIDNITTHEAKDKFFSRTIIQ